MTLSATILLAMIAAPQADDVAGLRRVEDGVVVRRVDEGVADRGPLGLSLRDMQIDLAVPGGFRGVYRIAGHGGALPGDRDDLLFRQSGAVVATFNRSVYRRDKEGNTIIDVPPGTVFSIGFPRWIADTESEARRIAAADRRDVEAAAMAGARALDARAELREVMSAMSGLTDLRVDLAMPSGRYAPRTAPRDRERSAASLEVDGDSLELEAPLRSDGDRASRRPPTPAVSDEPPRFTSDESYRRMRVASLLRRLETRNRPTE